MFSIDQKRTIATAIQELLRATNHPELPKGEIRFQLHVDGAEPWSWADIRNNGAVINPKPIAWNEGQAVNPGEYTLVKREDLERLVWAARRSIGSPNYLPGEVETALKPFEEIP